MTAYKDNKGKWYISINYIDSFGERRHTTKRGFTSKKDALDYKANFLARKITPNIRQSGTYHDSV